MKAKQENNDYQRRWGLPDWRDATTYPRTFDSKPMNWWAWQFMRRSPAYRDAFQNGGSAGPWGMAAIYNPKDAFLPEGADLLGGFRLQIGPKTQSLRLNESEIAVVLDRRMPLKTQLAAVERRLARDGLFQNGTRPKNSKKTTNDLPGLLRLLDAIDLPASAKLVEATSVIFRDGRAATDSFARDKAKRARELRDSFFENFAVEFRD